MPAGDPYALLADGGRGEELPWPTKGMLYAAKVMAASAIDALEAPAIIEQAKKEFQERTGGRSYDPPIPVGIKPRII